MKKLLSTAAGAALLLAAAQSSFAGVVSAGNLDYTLNLSAECEVTTTAGAVNLGTQASYAGNISNRAAGTVSVRCSKSKKYAICVGGGNNLSVANTAPRRLKDSTGTYYLSYALESPVDTPVGDKNCNAIDAVYSRSADWADPIGGAVSGGKGALTGDSPTIQKYDFFVDVTIPADSVPETYTDTVAVNVVW